MFIINCIKIGLIWIADIINRLFDPFEPFTRVIETDTTHSLAQKAEIFERDLLARYQIFGGTIYDYQYPQFSAVGDQALWHGVTTVMWALKGDTDRVSHCIAGLMIHQPGGRLIRGLDKMGVKQEDASNDQATGHLMGLYYAWKYGTPGIKIQAMFLIRDWALNILNHGHALVNPDGKSTKYGQLIDGWKTDPLRLTLCLAIYAATLKMTGDLDWAKPIDELASKYNSLIPYAKTKLLWWDNKNDAWRAAVHYGILEDTGICQKQATKGGDRLYRMVKKEGNCLVDLLLKVDKPNLTLMNEFSVNLKDNQEKLVIDRPTFRWGIWKWKTEPMTRQPIPIWKRGGQDFMWQRNLYSARNWVGNTSGWEYFNGVDFLLCYYLEKRNNG